MKEKLQLAISKLPTKQQDLIDKRFFEGLTLEDIAQEEGVSYQAIQNRLNKTLKQLKKNWNDIESTDG